MMQEAATTRSSELRAPELRQRREEYQEAGLRAQDLAGGLSPRQFWWRPDRKAWSLGECLDHLVRADLRYLDVIDRSIEQGWAAGRTGGGPFEPGILGRLLIHGVDPPARMRIPAPRSIQPRRPKDAGGGPGPAGHAGSPEDTAAVGQSKLPLHRFLELRGDLTERLWAADGLDLKRVQVTSPFVPLVHIALDTAFRVITGHERRHLWQAQRVMRDAGFPM